jgi:hypothetical protein
MKLLPFCNFDFLLDKRSDRSKSRLEVAHWVVLAFPLICAVLGCTLSVFSQTPSKPVPSEWLREGKLVAEEFNFSINSPNPNARWSYSRLPDIRGSECTNFSVETSKDTEFLITVVDMDSTNFGKRDSGDTGQLIDGMLESFP